MDAIDLTEGVTLLDNDNVRISARLTETDQGEDNDMQSSYLHQSSVFVYAPGIEDDDVYATTAYKLATAALELVSPQLTFRGNQPHLRYSEQAGCGTCLCSPGLLTFTRIFVQGQPDHAGHMDLFIAVK